MTQQTVRTLLTAAFFAAILSLTSCTKVNCEGGMAEFCVKNTSRNVMIGYWLGEQMDTLKPGEKSCIQTHIGDVVTFQVKDGANLSFEQEKCYREYPLFENF